MSNHVQQIDSQSFGRAVLESDQPVLVDFHADWCPPCRVLSPTIDAIAREYEGRATAGKVDVDANAALAERYGVRSIPTVLLFVGGDVVDRLVGIQSKDRLAQAVDDAIGKVAA